MKIPCLVLLCALAACSSIPPPAARREFADALAASRGWQALSVPAGHFDLHAYLPAQPRRGDLLSVYIEGDGLAWITSSRPSTDPTPRDPLALRLALAQTTGNAAYLARPCQYLSSPACSVDDWTQARFSAAAVDATNQAVDALKLRFGAQRLILVGYSGGGAIAALVAARRHDVERLLTVAGNLDHQAWTTLHRVSPLSESLNASDVSGALQNLRQWHFVGARDPIIPPELVENYARRFPARFQPTVRIIEDFDHRCCWAERWPQLWQEATTAP